MIFKKHANKALKAVKASLGSILRGRLAEVERKIDALERYSHGGRSTYIGNNRVLVKVVVQGANIAYIVEADDKLISPWFIITGEYETPLTNFFVREIKPDSHSIDVGANFGYFTCLLARFSPSGIVVGIEADRKVFEILRDNIAINGFLAFANAYHAAASDSEAEVTLYRRNTRSGNTSIIKFSEDFTRSLGEPASESFVVPGLTVDKLLGQMKGRVDFMKVDVEGCEPLVFAGARETIAHNPNLKIVMEWSPGQIQGAGFDLRNFLDSIEGQGLKAFDINEKGTEPMQFSDLMNAPYRAGVMFTKQGG